LTFALGTVNDGVPVLLVDGDRLADLRPYGIASIEAALADWDFSLLERAAGGDTFPLEGADVGIPYRPTQILQSGANYRQHVIDLAVDREIGRQPGMSIEDLRVDATRMMDARIANGEPYVFLGAPSALCGPYDDIVLPPQGDHDWELELAAVIGRAGRHVAVEDALDHVAAYTICNDLTTRDLVHRADMAAIGTDWLRGKNSPTFLPTGPWLVPKQFVGPTDELHITLRLNGDAMQDESTADMIFGVARLVSYVSNWVGLRPGDLLLTGSPAGNGTHYGRYLRPGDVLEGTITGLGTQRNRCVAE
jgi:2-keto-4-pentenoate hydratase/2-oxohepta-3-ene-1,7-dioic acid hydratase in catechol pathway